MMELIAPKSKKHCKLPKDLPLPIILKKDGSIKKIASYFNGFSVVVDDSDDMKALISKGYFGKATFSRSFPQFSKSDQAEILRQRQFTNRMSHFNKMPKETKPNKVITVPDSDSDNEEYFTNLQPKYELDYSGIKEEVWLGLEEAFFLATTVKCLDISFNTDKLDGEKLWALFQTEQTNFVQNYIAYYFYKGKNWIVKPGLKFGGDFILYKDGPPFYHSSYVVIIEVVDGSGNRIKELTNRPMDNVSILALNRLCETAGKELLICRIKWPQNNKISFNEFASIEIQEILIRRWIASQEREEKS